MSSSDHPNKRRRISHRDAGSAKTPEKQHELTAKVLQRAQTNIFRALKAARGFEGQKLGRRVKRTHAGSSTTVPSTTILDPAQDLAKLEAERDALKILDLTVLAKSTIVKLIARKEKEIGKAALAHSPLAQKSNVSAVEQTKDWQVETKENLDLNENVVEKRAKDNVVARLLNTAVVKTALTGVTTDLYGGEKAPSKGKGMEKSIKGSQTQKAKGDADYKSDLAEASQPGLAPLSDLESEAVISKTRNKSERDHEGSYSDAETGSFWSGSENSSDEEDSNHLSETPLDRRKRPRAKPVKPISSTTFLPALSMNTYLSGSEEASDIEEELLPRKNRRGQRARRAIFEKKYGAKAKHLQTAAIAAAQAKAEKEGKNRDAGWDARRGAQHGGDANLPPWRARAALSASAAAAGPATATNKIDVGIARTNRGTKLRQTTETEGPIHPSWTAAKEKQAKGRQILAAFQGKKVVF